MNFMNLSAIFCGVMRSQPYCLAMFRTLSSRLPIRESSFSCDLFVRLSGFCIFFYGSKPLIDRRFSFRHKETSCVFLGIFMAIIRLYPSIDQFRTAKMVFFAERLEAAFPVQTVFRFSRCGAGFGNKKSPHNNLNLTIPSGMALVWVRYVAIES